MAISKEVKGLIEKLFNEDSDTVLETLLLLKDKGNANFIEPLLNLLLSNPPYGVSLAITDLLANMKDKAAIDKYAELFTSEKYQPISHHLLSIFWNSTFFDRANPHISSIVAMGLKGNYATLFEALTLLEALEAPFDEAQLLDGITQCKTFVASNQQDEKATLAQHVISVLTQMDNINSDVNLLEP